MQKNYLKIFFYISVVIFIISYMLFILTFFGLTPEKILLLVWGLNNIAIANLVVVFFAEAIYRHFNGSDERSERYRFKTTKSRILAVFFIISVIAAFIFASSAQKTMIDGSPVMVDGRYTIYKSSQVYDEVDYQTFRTQLTNELRAFSGIWILFSAAPLGYTFLYVFAGKKKKRSVPKVTENGKCIIVPVKLTPDSDMHEPITDYLYKKTSGFS